jgi:hypothetical protein
MGGWNGQRYADPSVCVEVEDKVRRLNLLVFGYVDVCGHIPCFGY